MNYCYSDENGKIKNKYIVYNQQCIIRSFRLGRKETIIAGKAVKD